MKLVVDKTPAKPGETVLEIKDLVVKNERKLDAVKGLNLKVRKGEILGIAGIDGNGQKELVEAIGCLIPAEKGTITVCQHGPAHGHRQRRQHDSGGQAETRSRSGFLCQ